MGLGRSEGKLPHGVNSPVAAQKWKNGKVLFLLGLLLAAKGGKVEHLFLGWKRWRRESWTAEWTFPTGRHSFLPEPF